MKIAARFLTAIAALCACLASPAIAAEKAPVSTADEALKAAQANAPEVEAHPALWKIADKDTTIWLFGTVHILPPGVHWFDGPVKTAFDGADTLVTEIVEPPAADMQKLVISKAARSDGQTLRATLPADEETAYENAMTHSGLPTAAFDNVDTWFAAVTLGTLPILRAGYSPANGVDKQLVAKGDARKIPHIGLETAEYQLGLFDSLAPDVQRAYLSEVIDQLPKVQQQIGQMVTAWEKGDATELARLMNEDESAPQLMEVLLTNRNRNWARWIEQRLEQPGDVFIAVGAGHLAGPGSVQEQLKSAGIEAVRVQ